MINKKAELSIGPYQLIALILVVLVVVVVLVSIFSPRLWDWVRALPDYKYDDTDREFDDNPLTDLNAGGVCPDASKIGFVGEFRGDLGFREQYINFFIDDKNAVTSKLYWRRGENDGEIWLLEGKRSSWLEWLQGDVLVAKVVNHQIKVESKFLDLDLEIHQRARFFVNDANFLKENLEYLIKLDGAYPAFNNQICKVAKPEELKPAWPGSEEKVIKLDSDPHFKDKENVVEIRGLLEFVDVRDTGTEFLYLVNEKDYIEVRGYRSRAGLDRLEHDFSDIFRIYSDGSIWFPILYKGMDPRNYDYQAEKGVVLFDKRKNNSPEFLTRFNIYVNKPNSPSQAIETNLKLGEEWNYQKLRTLRG